ncbi:LarC family nickel insertion protein [Aquibacillus salsiterrae]|uniref:LarC family nickel insertion protein n=1 Tax=Aquibacillus salsiterrae TaxID=2950439 RepID=A0A9X3WCI0_9BACI|nr:LarC family nickel insertion protein [Aquibacillus salsiterrae]MDC3416088.1 LarC family nickel insertion protein [Aquibacillus salsiterrae]
MRTLYFDCFSGISGDMTLGALIDAGADPQFLKKELSKLKIESEYELHIEKVLRNGITSTKVDVLVNNAEERLTNQHTNHHSHGHHHKEHNPHDHEHDHHHSHGVEHDHHHSHRSYQDIIEMILNSGLTDRVKQLSHLIFKKIGEAEGKIHGVPLEKVHFHEVGAVDSIVDVIGTAILVEQLEIDKIIASKVPVGSGSIHIDHGVYPVPAPATLEILKQVPIQSSAIKAELCTPTGAAIVAVLADEFGTLPTMTVEAIGYGAGTKVFPNHPNVLRVIIGKS